jgi:hypothetical protein
VQPNNFFWLFAKGVGKKSVQELMYFNTLGQFVPTVYVSDISSKTEQRTYFVGKIIQLQFFLP